MIKIAKDFYELSVSSKKQSTNWHAGILKRLKLIPVTREQWIEGKTKTKSFVSTYVDSHRLANKFYATLKAATLKNAQVSLRFLPAKRWQEVWKKSLKPFRLTENIDVVPQWCSKKYRPTGRQVIYLDTVMAFGTGLHETTRFMSRLIEGEKGEIETFLDVGTGTGLLGLVARKIGAKDVWLLDYDPRCLETAEKNFKRNLLKFKRSIVTDFRTWEPPVTFDFVAANLISDDLINFKRNLLKCTKKDKFLAVSGISIKNLSRVLKSFEMLPVRLKKIIRGKEWAAVLFQKK